MEMKTKIIKHRIQLKNIKRKDLQQLKELRERNKDLFLNEYLSKFIV